MQLSMGEVAGALGGACAVPERVVRGYSIDSRTLRPGELFFAIRGPRHDGHDFLVSAFARGAVGAVVEYAFWRESPPLLKAELVPVVDTTRALQSLAQEVRRKWGRTLIAITGSTGKSTTKELIAAVLARRLNVLKSPGNLNNFYGLPLALLALDGAHEVAVVELAMSAPGEIACLAKIAEPQVGVVTNVAPVHLQFFDSLDSIARAKRELIENLKPPATAVLNQDDPRLRGFSEGFSGRLVTFGFNAKATIRGVEVRPERGGGSEFLVKGKNMEGEFHLSLPGRHNVQNALAAIAVATLFDLPTTEIQEALAAFINLPQRSEILTLPGPITVIDDSYNSNPLAMERMLELLAAWLGAGRRIVVAGEMLELGPTSPDLHRQIGQKCAECRTDWLVAIQGDARFILEGALEAGFNAERQRFFETAEQAGEFVAGLLKPGDVVLVKGSRGVHLERVIQLLTTLLQKLPAGQDVERKG